MAGSRRTPLLAAAFILLTGAAWEGVCLPFTVGAPVPLDIEWSEHGGKQYGIYTFSSLGETRPSILYGNASFMADRMTFDELSAQITAIGNVRVTFGSQLMFGDHLEYNLDSRRGILTAATMKSNEIHVTGGKIEIREIDIRDSDGISQAFSYEVKDGTITACEYAIPHYDLEGDFFRVVPEARVWLYGAVYRVIGVPIFYFPYLTRSLRKEPFCYVFEPGMDSHKGFVLLNRFHFHYDKTLHPMARGTVYVDEFTKQGVGLGARWTYLRRPEADSYLHGYWIDQQDDFGENTNARVNTEGSRGKIAYQHFQRFGTSWTLSGKGRRLSDPDFDEDYRSEELVRGFSEDELTSDRDAFLNLARRRTNSNFRVIYKDRLEDFNLLDIQEDQKTPEVLYDSKRRPFTGTDIYHRLKFSAGNYTSEQTTGVDNVARIRANRILPAGKYDADIHQEFMRAALFGELNRPFNFEDFSVIPFLSLEGQGYSDAIRHTKIWTHKGEHYNEKLIEEYGGFLRGIASAGAEFVTRRQIKFDDPSRGLERRLLLEPSITPMVQLPSKDLEDLDPDRSDHSNRTGAPLYSSPPYAILDSKDPQLDGIDVPGFPFIDETDSIRDEFAGFQFRLESRYQTRRAGGRTRDWLIASLSSAVDFTETDPGESQLATVYGELFVLPFDWLSYSMYLEYDPQGSFVRSFRNALLWSPNEILSLGVAYAEFQYDERSNDPQQDLSFLMDLNLSTRYKLSYAAHYDLDDSLLRLQRITFSRDFHDWILNVGVRESERETRARSVGTYFSLTLKTPKGVKGIPGSKTVTTQETGSGFPSS